LNIAAISEQLSIRHLFEMPISFAFPFMGRNERIINSGIMVKYTGILIFRCAAPFVHIATYMLQLSTVRCTFDLFASQVRASFFTSQGFT